MSVSRALCSMLRGLGAWIFPSTPGRTFLGFLGGTSAQNPTVLRGPERPHPG